MRLERGCVTVDEMRLSIPLASERATPQRRGLPIQYEYSSTERKQRGEQEYSSSIGSYYYS